MKEASASDTAIILFVIRHAPIELKFFLGKKFKNIDWWSTDVTLLSIAVNSAPACNYIQIA